MSPQKKFLRLASLMSAAVMVVSLFSGLVTAQRRRQPRRVAPRPASTSAPAATPRSVPNAAKPDTPQTKEIDRPIEELLSSDSYGVFIEVRKVGQLAQNAQLKTALDSLRMIGEMPNELNDLVQFLTVNREALSESRVLVGTMRVREELPAMLVAIQLSSVENATKFEPVLRNFISAQAKSVRGRTARSAADMRDERAGIRRRPSERETPAAAFNLKRAGSWLLAADEPFTLKRLKGGAGSTPLADNARLQAARSRFALESVFVHVDVTLVVRSSQLAAQKYARQAETAGMNGPTLTGVGPTDDTAAMSDPTAHEAPTIIEEVPTDSTDVEIISPEIIKSLPESKTGAQPETPVAGTEVPEPEGPSAADMEAMQQSYTFVRMLSRGLWSESSMRWPEAVAVGIGFEGDTIAVRALLSNPPGTPVNVIPFLPNVISGPPVTPETPTIAPADSEVFAAGTLDWTQIYNSLVSKGDAVPAREHASVSDENAGGESEAEKEPPPSAEKTIEAVEKLFNFKIKEELLPALGNEIALSTSMPELGFGGPNINAPMGPNKAQEKAENEAKAGTVVLIALNNPGTVRRILPSVLAAFGLAPPGVQAQAERRAGFDIHNYPNLSYVIINNFLAVAEDTRAIRHVVDSYSSQQTLAGANSFRNASGWQPRQKLGQVYVSDTLMKSVIAGTKMMSDDSSDPAVIMLRTQLDASPEAAAYAVTGEGDDLLHELHVPVGLVKSYAVAFMIGVKEAPLISNEIQAHYAMSTIFVAQEAYKAKQGNGRYGTLEELMATRGLDIDFMRNGEYKFEVRASGDKFEAEATPINYGKTARRSFFVDETGIVRGANHKGEPATVADPPVN